MKQKLTHNQICEICEAVPVNLSLPEYVRLSIISRIRTRLFNDLSTIQIYPHLFSSFKEEVVKYYYKTLVASGEAVGVQVAQSIGERQTQNTLNSIDWNDKVLLYDNEKCIVQPIGLYIDNMLEKNKEHIQHITENRTQYLDTNSYNIKMPSVDENGKTEWLKVEAITKHLPVGSLVKVKTQFGREVTATQSKSFLVWDSTLKKFIDKNGSDIRVGDYLPTTSNIDRVDQKMFSDKNVKLDRTYGHAIGSSYLSSIPSISYISNKDFQLGLLSGFFSKNGLFDKDSISVSSPNIDLIHGISFILYYFGIIGQISKNKDVYTLCIIDGTDAIIELLFGKGNVKNRDGKDVLLDQIVSIEHTTPSKEYVYDFTIEKTRNFIIFNGLGVRDTFHSSGLSIKTVVVGVPRFSELLNATKSPKMVNCLLYLNEDFTDVSHIRRRAGNMFTDMTLKRLTKSYELIKDEPLEEWHHLFCDIYEVNPAILGWRLRFHIDKDVMYEYQVTLKMIANAIMTEYNDAIVLYTPDSVGLLDVFVDEGCFTKIEKDKEKKEVVKDIDDGKEIEDEDNNDEDDNDGQEQLVDDILNVKGDDDISSDFIKHDVLLPIPSFRRHNEYKEDVVPLDVDRLIHMEDKVYPALSAIRICGIAGIKDIFFEKRKDEWIITTEGSNLYKLFSYPMIDKTKSMSNDMWEIYQIFGIEATRQFLIEEYMDIVSSDGTFVNSSNVELLVDVMVYTGSIISISRYGQKKVGCGPMAKASFEESLENFLKAGVNGEKENANGVSASIMLGKMPNIGTGVFDLIIDVQKLIDNAESSPTSPTSPTSPIDDEKEEIDKKDIKNEPIQESLVKKKGFVRNQTPIF
jgi:DNA-directed RNA polymerase beta' subunit